jgi:predicted O-methyltransferase YrrM
MDSNRRLLLDELERFGAENDRAATEHQAKMRNITPDTGAFLAVLVRAMKARRILEVGTSNGYSTIWLADAAETLGGRVATVEVMPARADMAQRNFARAGLAALIDLHVGDAGPFLQQQAPDSVDFLFLDSARGQYLAWWPDLRRVLAPGGLLVVDNAVSHPHEMSDFLRAIAVAAGFTTVLVPIGKGEFLAHKGTG